MLIPGTVETGRVEARNRRRERKLWNRPTLTPSLGCMTCPQQGVCGGLQTRLGLFDCMGHCCGKPDACSKVCRLKAGDFVQRVREIGGFDLGATPKSRVLATPDLPRVAPLIYHGQRRERLYTGPAVVLSLHRLLHRATGEPKFASEAALRAAFGLSDETKIILTGTDQDPPLERWWAYGAETRAAIIAAIKGLGVSLVTTPNYSLFVNTPRWDDLHSMKRIALVNAEFLTGGIASALHVNARTDTDIDRWAAFVRSREEINWVAYEFTTGSARAERQKVHARWLAKLAAGTARPLKLIVRGGIDILPILTDAFEAVTVVETSAFMKAMKRHRAVVSGNAGLAWEFGPTEAGAPVDDLFEHNVRLTTAAIELMSAPPLSKPGAAAA